MEGEEEEEESRRRVNANCNKEKFARLCFDIPLKEDFSKRTTATSAAVVAVMHPPLADKPSASPSFRSRRFHLLTIVLFVAVCAIFLFVYTFNIGSLPIHYDPDPFAIHRLVSHPPPPSDDLDSVSEDVRLERVLKEAAMLDKTVILTTLNAAWASPGSVLDLFLESFRIGDRTRQLLDHLVVVALDREAYSQCKLAHTHCFYLKTEGVDFSEQKNYMTRGYLLMMWRRIDFLRIILEKGYDFIFTDTDVLWFRDPLPQFYTEGDFQISCDHYWGNSLDLHNRPNGGFMYVKSSNQTIEFYKFWYASRLIYPNRHDQDVLNFIKRDPFLQEIGLQMRFLDTLYFGGLCEPSRDLNRVRTMHVNCCIGLSRKLHDLRSMLEDWKSFMSLPPSLKRSQFAFWSVPQTCRFELLNALREFLFLHSCNQKVSCLCNSKEGGFPVGAELPLDKMVASIYRHHRLRHHCRREEDGSCLSPVRSPDMVAKDGIQQIGRQSNLQDQKKR